MMNTLTNHQPVITAQNEGIGWKLDGHDPRLGAAYNIQIYIIVVYKLQNEYKLNLYMSIIFE